MRAESPAFRAKQIFGGSWLFFGYADCLRLMKDDRLSNARAAVPLRFLTEDQRAKFSDMVGVYEKWLAFHDGHQHTQSRRQANHSYASFTDDLLESRIQHLVDTLLNRVHPDGFDLMAEFAFPLPAMVIADVLGVPIEAHPDLTRWTDDIAHLFGSTHVTYSHLERTRLSTQELTQFLASPECRATSARKGGLLHRLQATEVHGYRFSEEDVVAQAALLLFAGVASIRYLIGNSVHALNQRPKSERQLLLRAETVGNAIEELLRFCTPVQFIGRVAHENFTLTLENGKTADIEANQPTILNIASANRDPTIFDQPDELVLTRPSPNRHLTFGAGRHLCFGDPLVRQTTRIALTTLYQRMPHLNVEPQSINWNNNLGFHGFTTLTVRNNLSNSNQASP